MGVSIIDYILRRKIMNLIDEVISFWFGKERDPLIIAKQKEQLWWGKDLAMDRVVSQRFMSVLEGINRGANTFLRDTARGRLALIVLLDQMSRMIYRNQPQAFAQDLQALGLSLDGIYRGFDRELQPLERVFFYLPLEHSESLEIQKKSVQCFTDLLDEVTLEAKELFTTYLIFAQRHLSIIERFGRFPHRNRVLGRISTDAEEAFLNEVV
jgi:uncharacterized protein (DUF924 family)